MQNLSSLNNLNALGIKGGAAIFDPSQIKVDGEKSLLQQLLTKQVPTLEGVITDERKNKGSARDIQLGRAYTGDGVNDYLQLPFDLDPTDTITYDGAGTITRDDANDRLNISGQVWNIRIEDVGVVTKAFYKCDEQDGTTSYDSSGEGQHATITNATLSTFHSTQNVYSWQNEVGYSKRMYFDGINTRVLYPLNVASGLDGATRLDFRVKFFLDAIPTSGNRFVFILPVSTLSGIALLLAPTGTLVFGARSINTDSFQSVTSAVQTKGFKDITGFVDFATKQVSMTINGVTVTVTGTFGSTVYTPGSSTTPFQIGDANTAPSQEISGVIYDVQISKDSVPYLTADGYGNTSADWIDKTNGALATVEGSPLAIYVPRNELVTTLCAFGCPLQYTGQVAYNAKLEQSNAIQLNGTTQYGSVTYNALFNITNNLSVTIRAKNNDATILGIETLIGRYSPAGDKRYWALTIDADEKLSLFLSSDGTTGTVGNYTSTSAVAINTAKTYGFTFASGTVKLFVDGVEVAGSVIAGSLPTTIGNATDLPITIGCVQQSVPTLFWDGQLYDARIYSGTVLTDAEMLAIHNGTETTVGATLVAHYPMACGAGSICRDASGNGNPLTLVNEPTWAKQDSYHYNLVNGCSKRMYFDGIDDRVNLGTFPSATLATITCSIRLEKGETQGTLFSSAYGTNANFLGSIEMGSTSSMSSLSSGTPVYTVDGNVITTRAQLYTALSDNLLHTVVISNANLSDWNEVNCMYYGYTPAYMTKGIMSDITMDETGNGSIGHSWKGYGNTDADWVDQIGSVDGTVVGSPSNVYIPAKSATLDALGGALTNPAGAYHNGAETLIDFTNNVLSPVAVINSWETAWAFNTARTNPEFKRTLTSSGVDHRADRFLAYRDTLSGANLTKVQNYTATKSL